MQPSSQDARAIASYEALMWAMARPGLPRTLPEPGEGCVMEALIDRECSVWCAQDALAAQAVAAGAALVAPEAADHLFAGELDSATLIARLRCGSDLYPDEGATLVVRATLAQGPRVRLSGPGVDGSVEVAIGGLPQGFWQARARAARYPMGFELFILDGAQVIGIPRSTQVEIL